MRAVAAAAVWLLATKLVGPVPDLAIASLTLVGETGFDFVHDFPRDRGLFNAYYATDNNSATTRAATVDGQSPFARKGLASQLSGAAIGEAIADVPGLLPWGIDMQPTIALRYDFLGTSPIGVNVFQQNTAAASMGVNFTYLQKIAFALQYTTHFPVLGPGKFYGLLDRDFVSATLTTSF